MHREMIGELADEMSYSEKVFTNQLFTGEEELFASKRCVSRLMEMRTEMYRAAPHRPGMGHAGLDTDCLEFDAPDIFDVVQPDAVEVNGSSTGSTAVADMAAKRGVPKFSAKHFWGAGWWEKVLSPK